MTDTLIEQLRAELSMALRRIRQLERDVDRLFAQKAKDGHRALPATGVVATSFEATPEGPERQQMA